MSTNEASGGPAQEGGLLINVQTNSQGVSHSQIWQHFQFGNIAVLPTNTSLIILLGLFSFNIGINPQ